MSNLPFHGNVSMTILLWGFLTGNKKINPYFLANLYFPFSREVPISQLQKFQNSKQNQFHSLGENFKILRYTYKYVDQILKQVNAVLH